MLDRAAGRNLHTAPEAPELAIARAEAIGDGCLGDEDHCARDEDGDAENEQASWPECDPELENSYRRSSLATAARWNEEMKGESALPCDARSDPLHRANESATWNEDHEKSRHRQTDWPWTAGAVRCDMFAIVHSNGYCGCFRGACCRDGDVAHADADDCDGRGDDGDDGGCDNGGSDQHRRSGLAEFVARPAKRHWRED